MWKYSGLVAASLLVAGLTVIAQESSSASKDGNTKSDQKSTEPAVVTRLMGYGKKQTGKVWRDEVTDERLFRLFDLADTKKEGVVTREQALTAAKQLESDQPERGGGRGQGGGQGFGGGGPGGGGGRGGGRGGFGRPQPGVILPGFVQDELKLSDSQKQQLADLQKEVDAKLDSLLTEEQRKQFKELKENAGRGGPGGPGGFGGPGGPPGGRGPGGGGPGGPRE